jgi:NAD(P)H dehydrogenase (quinone)
MKHLLVLAHPRRDSFTHSVAKAYAEAATTLGHEVAVRDLYAMNFNPVASEAESFTRGVGEPADDVRAEMAQVSEADVLVFACPVWWIAPPAMMKGWLDRVLRPGFAYGYRPDRKVGGLLTGKKGLVFTSAGSTVQEFLDSGKMQSIRTMWDIGTIRFCDMTLLDHVHFGPVGSRSSPEMIRQYLQQVRTTVQQHFGRP